MTYPKLLLFFAFPFFICSCGNNSIKNESTVESLQSIIDTIDSGNNEKLTYEESYDKALALWKIPFTELDIATSYGKAHVIISGPADAEPLVLLHGMNASSTMWYPNIQSFSEHHRVYAIDFLIEPGKSFCEGEINNTDEIVKWYYEIFDQLKLKKFSIVGASRGGWLAINIALYSEKSINKIALLSPAQAFIWIRPKSDILSNITYSMSPKRKNLRSTLETMTYNVDKLEQAYIDQYFIATNNAEINKCILQMTPFSRKELESLKIPILVLIGDNDIINNKKSLRMAERSIPNIETGTINNAGHFLSFDQPEVVNKKVLDFLSANNLSAKK